MVYCANISWFLWSKLRELRQVSYKESLDFLLIQRLTPSWLRIDFRIINFILLCRLNLRLIWLTWYLGSCLGSTLIWICAIHIRKSILLLSIVCLTIITLIIISWVLLIRRISIRPLIILAIGSPITIVLRNRISLLLLFFKLFKCIHFNLT